MQAKIVMDGNVVETIETYGAIIEGWQQLRGTFTVPETGYRDLEITFQKQSGNEVYIDDIRIFPLDGNMQGFVYDDQLRLTSTLDENNYATFFLKERSLISVVLILHINHPGLFLSVSKNC